MTAGSNSAVEPTFSEQLRDASEQASRAERATAFLLNALSRQDRDWLIDRLSPAQVDRVRLQLVELQSLGIQGSAPLEDRRWHEVLRRASIKSITETLIHEPLSLASACIGLLTPDRQAAVYEAVDVDIASRWRDGEGIAKQWPHALLDLVGQELARRLQVEVEAPPAGRTSWLSQAWHFGRRAVEPARRRLGRA